MYFARQQWGLLRGAALVWRKAWAGRAWAPGADQGSALRIRPKLGKLNDIGLSGNGLSHSSALFRYTLWKHRVLKAEVRCARLPVWLGATTPRLRPGTPMCRSTANPPEFAAPD